MYLHGVLYTRVVPWRRYKRVVVWKKAARAGRKVRATLHYNRNYSDFNLRPERPARSTLVSPRLKINDFHSTVPPPPPPRSHYNTIQRRVIITHLVFISPFRDNNRVLDSSQRNKSPFPFSVNACTVFICTIYIIYTRRIRIYRRTRRPFSQELTPRSSDVRLLFLGNHQIRINSRTNAHSVVETSSRHDW